MNSSFFGVTFLGSLFLAKTGGAEEVPEDFGEVTSEGELEALGDGKVLGDCGKALGELRGLANLGNVVFTLGANMSKAVNLSDFKDLSDFSLTLASIFSSFSFDNNTHR